MTRRGTAVAALLVGLLAAAPALRAADETDWRGRALALNQVTGDDPIEGQIKVLLEDRAAAKKLVEAAAPLAREKKQPFNYNAAYILGRVAVTLKDYDAGRAFYRVCTENAAKLRSREKLIQAFSGMLEVTDGLYDNKKYDQTAKVCQEFLETLEKEGIAAGLNDEILRKMIRALAKQGKADEANRMIDNLSKARPNDWRNKELKAWVQNETGKKEEAAKTYEEVIPLLARDRAMNPRQQAAGRAQIHFLVSRIYKELKKPAKAKEQTEAAAKDYEEVVAQINKDESLGKREGGELLAEYHYLLHQVYSDLGETAKTDEHLRAAAKAYEDLMAVIGDDKDLDKERRAKELAAVRYTLSSIYVDLKRVDKASEQLKALLDEQPDNPTYNNDLGYIWADHNMNLDEAERLIRKALDEDRKQQAKDKPGEAKDNAAYLDSLGWVLFKKKKYQEAKPILQKAVEDKEGQHVEIYDHLGDVYMALGDKAAAISAWKKGLDAAGPGKREQERKAQVEKKVLEVEKTVKNNP